MPAVTQNPLPNRTPLYNGVYVIEAHLGTGGFGITYRAQEPKRNRMVAIKEFYPTGCLRNGRKLIAGGDWDEEFLSEYKNSFLEECRILSTLKHPGIVSVLRFFMENDTIYLVMEFLEGQTLSQYLRTHHNAPPIEEALSIICAAGEALAVVHEAGLLHRDLKPGNIMRRGNGQAVLIDFGAARDMEISQTPIGTPGYMPLEQLESQSGRISGPYTDVYALAATLYKLLTGITPTDARSRILLSLAEPRELRPEISETLSEAVMWGMELKAEERPQTVAEFLTALSNDPPWEITKSSGIAEPLSKGPSSLAAVEKTRLPIKPEDWGVFQAGEYVSETVSARQTTTQINTIDGAEMIWIPPGEFLMGSRPIEIESLWQQHVDWKREWFADETPQRSVYLDGYSLYKTPVTVAQYLKFCEATRYRKPPEPVWNRKNFNPHWQYADHPIVDVSWEDAKAYCEWAGVSLPTEAQWEKAARGTDARRFPWGDEWYAGHCHCSRHTTGDAKSTSSVGAYPSGASPYGVLDMAGNVWEWCADWYDSDYYQSAPDHNPTGPAEGELRSLRGGSWDGRNGYYFRCACRLRFSPTLRGGSCGFRCVSRLEVLPPDEEK